VSFPPEGFSHEVLPIHPECIAPRERWQEWFSWAFVMSIATAAGLVVQVPTVDSQKKDLQVETWRPFEGRQRVIGLQLKSTFTPTFTDEGGNVAYDLKRDDYNGMLVPGSIPRFLVVVAVPKPTNPLVSIHAPHCRLHGAAWWGKVPGPETAQATKRVTIPSSQRLTSAAVFEMLRES